MKTIGTYLFSFLHCGIIRGPYPLDSLISRPAVYSPMGPCARPEYCQGTKPGGADPQHHSGSPVPEDRQVQNWLSSGLGLVL